MISGSDQRPISFDPFNACRSCGGELAEPQVVYRSKSRERSRNTWRLAHCRHGAPIVRPTIGMTTDDAAEPVDELLAAAYALDGPDANRALYARWADTYDSGFVVASGYTYPAIVADVFAANGLHVVGAEEAIVDIGCGTGLAGQALRRHRRVIIDGIDISTEMLRQSASKRHDGIPVYRTLLAADLTRPLDIADGAYAGAVSVGTFTHGHVGPEVLTGTLRIIRPGGRAAIGINAAHFVAAGFGTTLDSLVERGRITDLQLIDAAIYENSDMTDPDQYAHIAVFTVR